MSPPCRCSSRSGSTQGDRVPVRAIHAAGLRHEIDVRSDRAHRSVGVWRTSDASPPEPVQFARLALGSIMLSTAEKEALAHPILPTSIAQAAPLRCKSSSSSKVWSPSRGLSPSSKKGKCRLVTAGPASARARNLASDCKISGASFLIFSFILSTLFENVRFTLVIMPPSPFGASIPQVQACV